MSGGGRSSLTASVLLESGAYSDDDDDDDDLDGVAEAERGFDIDDDEETEVLIYDAESQAEEFAQAMVMRAFAEHQQQIAAFTEPSVEDLSVTIAHDMQRLNIGVPKLETTMMSIVVQFWADDADTPLAFLLEIDEMYVPRETMTNFCTKLCEAPFRARMPIDIEEEDSEATESIHESDEEEVIEDAASEDAVQQLANTKDEQGDSQFRTSNISLMCNTCMEACAASCTHHPAASPQGQSEDTGVVVDDVPEGWIPERGRVSVLAIMYAQAPVIIGVLTERYDVNHRQRLCGGMDDGDTQDDFNLDRLNANGKRIQWLDGAAGTKRPRVEDADGASSAKENDAQDDSPMFLGMHGFAAVGSHEWTSVINRDALVCAFERDDVTGQLKEVRVALALHVLGLRHSLQQMLQDTRNNL